MRTFDYQVTASRAGFRMRDEYRSWCEDQFGPSNVEVVYYYQDGRVEVEGDGRWIVIPSGARFEFAEHAIAFKLRWG